MGSLNPRQTVYEAVAEGLRIQKRAGNEAVRVADALARAGLRPPERFVQLYPYELSGGQRQRVVIARAMALEPSLLVADEPVSSLDASVRGEILKLMLELVHDAGVTIFVVTHDLGLAWNIADRIAVMYLGRIVEEGPTRSSSRTRTIRTRAPSSRSCPKRGRWSSRSCRAKRPTRPGSPRAAGSIRVARWSHRGKRHGSGLRSGAAPRTSPYEAQATSTAPRATRLPARNGLGGPRAAGASTRLRARNSGPPVVSRYVTAPEPYPPFEELDHEDPRSPTGASSSSGSWASGRRRRGCWSVRAPISRSPACSLVPGARSTSPSESSSNAPSAERTRENVMPPLRWRRDR